RQPDQIRFYFWDRRYREFAFLLDKPPFLCGGVCVRVLISVKSKATSHPIDNVLLCAVKCRSRVGTGHFAERDQIVFRLGPSAQQLLKPFGPQVLDGRRALMARNPSVPFDSLHRPRASAVVPRRTPGLHEIGNQLVYRARLAKFRPTSGIDGKEMA